MTLSQYTLLSASGTGLIVASFVGLIAGAAVLAVTLFVAGAVLVAGAAVGALWFSGPWRKPGGKNRSVVIHWR